MPPNAIEAPFYFHMHFFHTAWGKANKVHYLFGRISVMILNFVVNAKLIYHKFQLKSFKHSLSHKIGKAVIVHVLFYGFSCSVSF